MGLQSLINDGSFAVRLPAQREHRHDDDCTLDEETSTCIECGVTHEEACAECGQRAYHKSNCSEMAKDPADAAGAGARQSFTFNPEDLTP